MVMPSLVTRSDTSNIGILSHTRNQIALIRYSVNWSCWLPWMSIQASQDNKFKPDDHSEVVPLLPIPNRTVKRLCANDSAGSRVKVGHRQANEESLLSSGRAARLVAEVAMPSRFRWTREPVGLNRHFGGAALWVLN